MFGKTIRRILFGVAIVVLLLASFFAGRVLNRTMNVQAQDDVEGGDRGEFACFVNEVALLSNRIHLRCDTTATIKYFAIANTSANETLINRVMAIGLTNMSMNRNVYIYYDSNSANNPAGCLVSNCRKLTGVIGYK